MVHSNPTLRPRESSRRRVRLERSKKDQSMKKTWIAAALLCAAFAAFAQSAPKLTIAHAWARPTVPGQPTSGAYMTLTAGEPLVLVGASTPVAGMAEVHQMKMEGDVMRMGAVEGIALPAGQPVELKPGGYHIMLMHLNAPLKAGTNIPLTLTLKNASGAQVQVQASVPVSAQPPAH
jgi:periplasmic copper chaperone A